MADNDLGPEGFGTRGIPSARRGYDKRVVDTLVEEAVERWAELKRRYDELSDAVEEAGGLDNLKRDLHEIGDEVSRILTAAGDAATGLRARAKEEADQRVAASAAEAETKVAEAEQTAFELRREAWETGTELIELAREAAAAIIQEAEAESLLVRADAEKEAHRRLAVTRKELDDLIRNAKYDLDRQIAQARDLAAEILSAPNTDENPIVPSQNLSERRRQLLGEIDRIRASKAIEEVSVLPAEPAPGPADDELLFGELDPNEPAISEAIAAEVQRLTDNGGRRTQPSQPAPRRRTGTMSPSDDVGTLFEALRGTGEHEAVDLPVDPVSVRDRVVLPAHNLGVREMKRRLADLQTAVVDALSDDVEWVPDPATLAQQLSPALESAVKRAAVGGVTAARTLAGVEAEGPEHPERTRRLVATMTRDLSDQLAAALAVEDADPADSVAVVFRAWRTDRVERWVRAIVTASYHDELLGALAGTTEVRGILVGTACAECPAAAQIVWDPRQGPGEGYRVPPAHLECSCTLAPA